MRTNFYIVIGILIAILLCITIQSKLFVYRSLSGVSFIETLDACKIMTDPTYLSLFNRTDMLARKLENKDLQRIYCDNIIPISIDDKQSVIWLINILRDKFTDNFFKYWKFIKINKKIENGLPHTRKDLIVLPESVFKNLNIYKQDNLVEKSIYHIGGLFIHEKVHILQKRYPKLFEDLYINYWNFVKVKRILNSDNLVKNTRTNPDGVDLKWVYKANNKYIWLLSVYNGEDSLFDVDYVGVYLEPVNINKSIFKIVGKEPLTNINSFISFFGIDSNYYHPNEISAEIFSNYFLDKLGYSMKTGIAINKFKDWYSVNGKYLI